MPPPFPPLPPEEPFTDAEFNFRDDEPRRLFPENQDSNWGLLRKIYADELDKLYQKLQLIWTEMFPQSSVEFLDEWERMVGLPRNPANTSVAQRRALVMARLQQGPFTRTRRWNIVNDFITATFGDAIRLYPDGVALVTAGVPIYNDTPPGDVYFVIKEIVETFYYEIQIWNYLSGINENGLRNALDFVQYAGLHYRFRYVPDFTLPPVDVTTPGGSSSAKSGFAIGSGKGAGKENKIDTERGFGKIGGIGSGASLYSLSYEGVTSWARPAFTPTRTVNFTTGAQLNTALSGMAAGDLIQYTGTGILEINPNPYYENFSNKNPASTVVIDLGLPSSANHVHFKCLLANEVNRAVYLHESSNLRIYGGEFSTPNGGNEAILVHGGDGTNTTHDILWWDFYTHNSGGGGIALFPTKPSGGGVSAIYNCWIRGEVASWGQNLAWDPHAEAGTGIHGCNCADVHSTSTGDSGKFYNNIVAIYAHDSGSGAGMEFGEAAGTNADLTGNTLYIKAVNLTKVATSQVAANALQLWGGIDCGNTVIGWAEGNNLQGRVVDGQGVDNNTIFNSLVVQHGRNHNTNQNPNLGSTESGISSSQPYEDRKGIIYNDNQAF